MIIVLAVALVIIFGILGAELLIGLAATVKEHLKMFSVLHRIKKHPHPPPSCHWPNPDHPVDRLPTASTYDEEPYTAP